MQLWTTVFYIMLGDCITTSVDERNTKVTQSSYISKVNKLRNAVPNAVRPIWWRMVFALAISLPIGGKKVILRMKVRRYKCKCTDCDYDCQERIFFARAVTIRAYRTGIPAWYDCSISTGKVEGINNKIKMMKRVAYGFSDERYFRLRLYVLHDCRITQMSDEPFFVCSRRIARYVFKSV